MLKIYNWLKSHNEKLELVLAKILENNLNSCESSRFFYFQVILRSIELFILQLSVDIVKLLIIVSSDSSVGFNILYRQQDLETCSHSYVVFRRIQSKTRLFSALGVVFIVTSAILTSLVTNLIFGGKSSTFAASFGWTQNDWSQGYDATAKANHLTNLGLPNYWKYFASSSLIKILTNGTLTLATTTLATSTFDFSTSGLDNSFMNNGFPTIKKLDNAKCATTTECSNGACTQDFDNISQKYCHSNSSKCIDWISKLSGVEYNNTDLHCSGNAYNKTCGASGLWGATTTPSASVACTPSNGVNSGMANGGWQQATTTCTEGAGFITTPCNSCTLGYVAAVVNNGCYANCTSNDDAKCMSGYHCYAGDNTCKSNVNGSLCDLSSECTSGYCHGTCKTVPLACSDPSHVCGNDCSYKGDSYSTVDINGTCWFSEGLRATSTPVGVALGVEADCSPSGCTSPRGRHYNWNTTTQGVYATGTGAKIQGICPSNWHIPSDYNASPLDDFQKLVNFLGGTSTAGGAMKQVGTATWLSPNTGATNSSGFTALAEGYSDQYHTWNANGVYAYYYTSSVSNPNNYVWARYLEYNSSILVRYGGINIDSMKSHFSIRCVKN